MTESGVVANNDEQRHKRKEVQDDRRLSDTGIAGEAQTTEHDQIDVDTK